MNLKRAKALRDEITKLIGAYCTVPLGNGPDGYFCRIWRAEKHGEPAKPRDFHSRREFLNFYEEWKIEQRKRRQAIAAMERRREVAGLTLGEHRRSRSPIEIMVDRACGLE